MTPSSLAAGVITGPPRTKKNSPRRLARFDKKLGRSRTYEVPSLAYEEWDQYAVLQLRHMARLRVAVDVNCKALFYRAALVGDACGYYQALADTLEHAGVVVNDKYIVSWDGSRMLKDRANPRVEFELTEAKNDTPGFLSSETKHGAAEDN